MREERERERGEKRTPADSLVRRGPSDYIPLLKGLLGADQHIRRFSAMSAGHGAEQQSCFLALIVGTPCVHSLRKRHLDSVLTKWRRVLAGICKVS